MPVSVYPQAKLLGTGGGANAPPIFLPSKTNFLSTEFNTRKQ